LGADVVVDYGREDFTKSGRQHDVVLDLIGKRAVERRRTSRGYVTLTLARDRVPRPFVSPGVHRLDPAH
jgi:hypothetical protein